MIRELGGLAEPGRFPLEFTALNDLSAGYLAKKTAALQVRNIEITQQVAEELADSPRLQALAEDMLQLAKQHQSDLEALACSAT